MNNFKGFDKESGKFIIGRFTPGNNTFEDLFFDNFEDYYTHLNGNLAGSNLKDFDFKSLDVSGINIDGALIDSSILIRDNCYDSEFFTNNIMPSFRLFSKEIDVVDEQFNVSVEHGLRIPDGQNDSSSIYYVTDLHLDFKLMEEFPNHASENEIRWFMKGIVRDMCSGCVFSRSNNFLLIGGDVSWNIIIARMFYEELVKVVPSSRIVAVLGNHELWFNNSSDVLDVDDIIGEYEQMFNTLHIAFVQDGLLAYKREGRCLAHCQDIMDASVEDIREYLIDSELNILAGIGFAAYNTVYNQRMGLYKNTICSYDEELRRTMEFEALHEKVREAVGDLPVIVLTHMPMTDWSRFDYNKGWYYVSGHTHRNDVIIDNGLNVFQDNQIGYTGHRIQLKSFPMYVGYDIFRDFSDGIYEISRDEYINFYRGQGMSIDYNRTKTVTMLKNNGFMMFIIKSTRDGLNLLKGGSMKHLDNPDVQYYYDNLPKVADFITRIIDGYMSRMEMISKQIRSFGGTGNIHGCIVDIDFSNHVFVNPVDMKVTGYHASDIQDKDIYENIPSLIYHRCPELWDKMLICSEKAEEHALIDLNMKVTNHIVKYHETEIYRYSRIMRGLQYLRYNRLIRFWNDDFIHGDVKSNGEFVWNALSEGYDD